MLTFEFIDRKGTLRKWTKMSIAPTLEGVMKNAMLAIKAHSKAHYLTGPRPQKLGVVTGRLRSSLHTAVERRGNDVIGKIGTNVHYGHFWEKIGRKGTRPFLKPAIDDKKEEIWRHCKKAIEAHLEK